MTFTIKLPRSLRAAGLLAAFTVLGSAAIAEPTPASAGLLDDYRKVVPLEGGSNFRDLGGYETADGRRVKRGLLYRSGVMSSLTAADQAYLNQFGFQTVVDLRGKEELDLFPNHWARKAEISYLNHDYSLLQMMASSSDAAEERPVYDPAAFYRVMPYNLKPQLRMYFEQALAGEAPMVVNCSAGQDRTGVTAALMLTALGVPRQYVMYDYVLSTWFRRPTIEMSSVDLQEAAESNAFAKMMLQFSRGEEPKASPLITEEGIPYLYYSFEQIEADHGSVLAFLDTELGVDAADVEKLKTLYLE